METPIIKEIQLQRKNAQRANKKFPNYVMVNTYRFAALKAEIEGTLRKTSDAELRKGELFGMKIVFTPAIEADEVICTYKA